VICLRSYHIIFVRVDHCSIGVLSDASPHFDDAVGLLVSL